MLYFFLILTCELSQCLINRRLKFIIIIEDKIGKNRIVVHQIHKRKNNAMFVILESLLNSQLVLGFIVLLKILNETSKPSLNIVVKLFLRDLTSLYLHDGAKILSN